MNYQTNFSTVNSLLDYLYQIPARKTRKNTTPSIVTATLLELLDNPQQKIKSVLVTGSKGKGSVSIMLATLLEKTGIEKVGLFTSPHLYHFSERIKLNGQPISDSDLLRLAAIVLKQCNVLRVKARINNHLKEWTDDLPRFFEIVVVITYLYYAEKKVDFAVIEAGIGAKTDATNQGSHCLSVLTNVEKEHLDIFGNEENLLEEKLGVIVENTPLIIGCFNQDNMDKIKEIAFTKSATINQISTAFENKFKGLMTDSEIKRKNGLMAIKALEVLEIDFNKKQITQQLNRLQLPARQQIISKNPFVIIDSAHTMESALQLKKYVDNFTKDYQGHCRLLVSFTAEKNLTSVIDVFTNNDIHSLDEIIITEAEKIRTMSVNKSQDIIHQLSTVKTRMMPALKENLMQEIAQLSDEDILIITGSVYLAGLVNHWLVKL